MSSLPGPCPDDCRAGLGSDCPGRRHAPYCWKLDPDHPHYDPARWRPILEAKARGEVPPPPPPRPPRPPSLLTQAAGFGAAVARHAAGGFPHVSPEAKAARLAVCEACDQFDAGRVRCRACGCKLALKASWKLEQCPLGKWGPEA